MTVFKVGDRLRVKPDKGGWSGVEGRFLRSDPEYTWFVPDADATYTSGTNREIPKRYQTEGAGFYHTSYELVEPVVLKAGDRVRVKKSAGHWAGIKGTYVARRNDGYGRNDYFRPDVDSVYVNGQPIISDYPHRAEGVGVDIGALELIEAAKTPEQTELEELRAFKAEMLIKYPELTPIDPDVKLAMEIASSQGFNEHSDENVRNGKWEGTAAHCVYKGIKLGRKLEKEG
jgi:hypothetical protein